MPQQTINIGTNPNDGTGDQNRTAWGKVNAMFTEVYASIQALTNGLSGKADLGQIIRTDIESVAVAARKLRAALNGGSLIPLVAELAAPDAAVIAGVYYAFTVPADFLLYESTLTFRDAESGATITAALQKEEANGSWTQIHNASGGIFGRRIVLGTTGEGISIPAGTSLRVNVTAAVDGYAGDTLGMGVWLRGVWA